ncbi:MAG TPA: ATP-binding protein [Vicinamibacteria bacterium]|nr:ATP-binding protein [Vicinamibacteria bacterium]
MGGQQSRREDSERPVAHARCVVIGPSDLMPELGRTIVWRSEVQRVFAPDRQAGLEATRSARPNLVIVDGADRAATLSLVRDLRDQPGTRSIAIAVLSRDPAVADEEDLLEAGATLVLSEPVDPELWDARLQELLEVPRRRAVRIAVHLAVWSFGGGDPPIEGVALNISIHGMLLETRQPLGVGTKLDLRFALPGSAGELRAVAQVTRLAGQVSSRFRYGVRFMVLRGDARTRIRGFAERATLSDLAVRRRGEGGETEEWEAELRRSEAWKNAVLESVLDGLVTTDHEGHILEFNRAAEAVFGFTRAEVIGRRFAEVLVPLSLREAHRGGMARFVAAEGLLDRGRIETLALRRDGSEFPVELTVFPLHLDRRRLFTLTLRDITERRALEAQFRQAQKMEAVGRLAGGVAHDFNNHLGIISAYAELLARGLPGGSREREKAKAIVRAVERAAGLTRQLLAFSRKQALEPRLIAVNALVSDLLGMLRRLVGEDVQLVSRLDPDAGSVKADPSQMEQVIMNLVVNARDAMPQGGKISLETRREGNEVALSVQDTGLGMAPDTLRHIFEPFFTTKKKGTGLGLATVYGIVRQSGGQIAVESRPGHGTRFDILLPSAAGIPHQQSAEAAGNGVGAETVLLVEDEDELRKVTREGLELSGYRVLEAGSGEEAEEVSRKHLGPIHVLVSDIVMGGMSGPELAARLSSSRRETRVLFTSGHADDTLGDRGASGSSAPLLPKPFTPALLARKLRELLDEPPT